MCPNLGSGDPALGFFDLGAALARGHLLGDDAASQNQQALHHLISVLGRPVRPVRWRHGNEQALVGAPDMLGQVVGGDIELRRLLAVRVLNAALEQRQQVVGQHRHGKAQQCRARVAQGRDLAVEHRFESPEHAFNAPAAPVKTGNLFSLDGLGQVAPQPQRGLARLAGLIELEFNAPPG